MYTADVPFIKTPFFSLFRLFMNWKLFINLLANCGIDEELWTEEKQSVLDNYIEDTSISAMVVYVGSNMELQVEYSQPSQV